MQSVQTHGTQKVRVHSKGSHRIQQMGQRSGLVPVINGTSFDGTCPVEGGRRRGVRGVWEGSRKPKRGSRGARAIGPSPQHFRPPLIFNLGT
eukprot:COSAG02_NODE_417_length_22746_cov_9.074172_15_plen_92_part_00